MRSLTDNLLRRSWSSANSQALNNPSYCPSYRKRMLRVLSRVARSWL